MLRYQLLILCAGVLLVSCAPTANPSKGASVAASGEKVQQSFPQLRQELAKLPGAQVSTGEPLLVSYPTGSLFAEAALLPMPGGAGMLDALAALIRQSGMKWHLRVRALTGEGEAYDSQLAAQRVRVLSTYLQEAGVDLKKISLVSRAESGAPLELRVDN